MSVILRFMYIWIPSYLGGYSGEPYKGMRTTVRWQRFLSEYLQCARDIQWDETEFEPATAQGVATCRFTSSMPLPDEWLKEGELIEILSGFRVLAIGKIIN